MLSACGSKSEVSYTQPDGSLDECTLYFSWWGGDDRHEATLEAIEIWNELHPEITIVAEYGGWDGWTEKISAQISGNTVPDVMQINYDWLINFSKDGLGFYDLYTLDNLDLSGYDEETLLFGEVKGHLNAVTVSMSGRGLFYNSEVYDSIGASYPETWDATSLPLVRPLKAMVFILSTSIFKREVRHGILLWFTFSRLQEENLFQWTAISGSPWRI